MRASCLYLPQFRKVLYSKELHYFHKIPEVRADLGSDLDGEMTAYDSFNQDFTADRTEIWDMYAMYLGKQVIARSGLYQNSPLNSKELWLGWTIVAPKYRGQGHGTDLVSAMIDLARMYGKEAILLYCDRDMEEFYSKLGFGVVDPESYIKEAAGNELISDPDWHGLIMKRSLK